MFCGKKIGTKPCASEQNGLISHGVCPACYARAMADIKELKRRQENENYHNHCNYSAHPFRGLGAGKNK